MLSSPLLPALIVLSRYPTLFKLRLPALLLHEFCPEFLLSLIPAVVVARQAPEEFALPAAVIAGDPAMQSAVTRPSINIGDRSATYTASLFYSLIHLIPHSTVLYTPGYTRSPQPQY